MTYSSGNPAPALHPKLADSKWRYMNSWWVLLPPLSLGFLSWLAFLIAAARSGLKTLWASAALYAALLAGATVLNSVDRDGIGGNIAVFFLLAGCWLGASVHAMIANRSYLSTLATKSAWYDGAATQPSPTGTSGGAPILGVSQDEYFAPTGYPTTPPPSGPPTAAPTAPPTAPPTAAPAAPPAVLPAVPSAAPVPSVGEAGGRIDVNAATPQALGELPGVGEELAHRIIGARDSRGGFRDLDDLVAAAQLQPHELVRLRDRLTFGQSGPGGPGRPQRGTGRILDI